MNVLNLGGVYLIETVADAAKLRGELAGWADDGMEEAFSDLQQVSLIIFQVLTLFQSDE